MLTSAAVLMGTERSGTNLLARMLDAHPLVASPPPAHLVRRLAEHRPRYGNLGDDRNWRELLRDTADLLATALAPWRSTWTAERLAAEVRPRGLVPLLRHVHAREVQARGKRRLFLKENHVHRFLPLLQRTFPGLKVVWLVRDPRDMALSWKNSPVRRGDVLRAAGVWHDDQRGALAVLGCLEPGRDVHLLTYEDLLANPEGELARLCRFLELPFDQAMLTFHRRREAAAQARATDLWRNLVQPVQADNTRKYRAGLDRDEIAYVESVCGPEMRALGYAPEIADPPPVAELRARLRPRERWEKPGWATVPAAERERLRARAAVVARMAARPLDLDWLRRHSTGGERPAATVDREAIHA